MPDTKGKISSLLQQHEQRQREAISTAERLRAENEERSRASVALLNEIVLPVLERLVEEIQQQGGTASVTKQLNINVPNMTLSFAPPFVNRNKKALPSTMTISCAGSGFNVKYEIWTLRGRIEPGAFDVIARPSSVGVQTAEWVESTSVKFLENVLEQNAPKADKALERARAALL